MTALAAAQRHGADNRDLSHTLTQQLQEQLCTASFLDPRTLCLQPGKHCWHIIVDVRVLNDDGGLADACLLAASFALKSVQVRKLGYNQLKRGTRKLLNGLIDPVCTGTRYAR